MLSLVYLLSAIVSFFFSLQVADFLAKRRDNMFLEFDVSISHSVRDTFLSTGNEAAYRVRTIRQALFMDKIRKRSCKCPSECELERSNDIQNI